MPTIRYENLDDSTTTVVLKGEQAKHISGSLRMTKGEFVQLTSGQGDLYSARIESSHKKEVRLLIEKKLPSPPAPYPVSINVAVIKPERMEPILDMAVSLNITGMNIFYSQFSQHNAMSDSKRERFSKLIETIATQCGRTHPFDFRLFKTKEEVFNHQLDHTHIVCHESEEKFMLPHILSQSSKPVSLWIGPEGGWSEPESHWFTQHQMQRTSLGPLILRAEWAGVHAISATIALAFSK